jgi:hypothetical protein
VRVPVTQVTEKYPAVYRSSTFYVVKNALSQTGEMVEFTTLGYKQKL